MRGPSRRALTHVIQHALREDRATRDITSRATLPAMAPLRARIVARETGVLAGTAAAVTTFRLQARTLRVRLMRADGDQLHRGTVILTVTGRARAILAAERTALNLLGHLSGIATLTRRYVDRAKRPRVQILDTRKTLPGLRELEKAAVRSGGGTSHRSDLSRAVLIKTNHILALRGQRIAYRHALTETIHRAQRRTRGRSIEVEVRNMAEFRTALQAGADIILLDNWSVPRVRRAVSFLNAHRSTLDARPVLEASGGVHLGNVRQMARTGVDRISIGRLTHSAPALDVALEVIK